MTKIIKMDPINPDLNIINDIVNILRKGGLCAFPTETVYGLGADGFNSEAVIKIFKVKKRPLDNPLILHIDSQEMLEEVAIEIPNIAYEIVKKLWPGPLTILLKKSEKVPKEVTANLPNVAVRCPAHPIALSLIKNLERPIAAPSANISGKPSPTIAEYVIEDLMGLIDVIIDGGETFFGIESTIIDITKDPPILLRPGPITPEDIKRVLGIEVKIIPLAKGYSEAEVALSPGIKYKHYSPNTPLILIEPSNDLNLLINTVIEKAKEFKNKGYKIAIIGTSETISYYKDYKTINIGSRKNLYEIARNLYKILREIDELDVDIAIIEGFRDELGLEIAIMNRLRKASFQRIILK
ncbi:MAG: L-threonylcarbamoyladenylate synthase [Candidatus Methanomethylicaceae archaeon]